MQVRRRRVGVRSDWARTARAGALASSARGVMRAFWGMRKSKDKHQSLQVGGAPVASDACPHPVSVLDIALPKDVGGTLRRAAFVQRSDVRASRLPTLEGPKSKKITRRIGRVAVD